MVLCIDLKGKQHYCKKCFTLGSQIPPSEALGGGGGGRDKQIHCISSVISQLQLVTKCKAQNLPKNPTESQHSSRS